MKPSMLGAAAGLIALALGGLALQNHALSKKLDRLEAKLTNLSAPEPEVSGDSPPAWAPGPRSAMNLGALRLIIREELERSHVGSDEEPAETATEKAEREASMEQGAEAEAAQLVAALLHRDTTAAEWEALGAKVSALEGEEYRDTVRRRILVFINRQELRPPDGVNPVAALNGTASP